jgi:hypothetical protein
MCVRVTAQARFAVTAGPGRSSAQCARPVGPAENPGIWERGKG